MAETDSMEITGDDVGHVALAEPTVPYSPSLNGWFHREIHGENVPADCVEVPKADYDRIMSAHANDGKIVAAGPDGFPQAIDPPPPTRAQLVDRLRRNVESELKATAHLIAADEDDGLREAALAYRKTIKGYLDPAVDPASVVWPDRPTR